MSAAMRRTSVADTSGPRSILKLHAICSVDSYRALPLRKGTLSSTSSLRPWSPISSSRQSSGRALCVM